MRGAAPSASISANDRVMPFHSSSVSRQAGLLLDAEEQPRQQFEVDVDAPDELLLAHHGVDRGFALDGLHLQDRAGKVYEERPFFQRVVPQPRGEGDRTFGTKNDGEGVQTGRVAEQADVEFVRHIDARSDHAAIVIEVSRAQGVGFEKRGERETPDVLFVHFMLDFFANIVNRETVFRRKVRNRTNRRI